MTLATVDGEGRPHCRVLLLKGLDERGFTFFTNYESAKGQQLLVNPFAAMTFFWPALERQVRIEGRVEKVSAKESDDYYQVRPLGSRLVAARAVGSVIARGPLAALAITRYGLIFIPSSAAKTQSSAPCHCDDEVIHDYSWSHW